MSLPATLPPGETQAVLSINLGALADNWRLLSAKAAPAECGAVVKADAYGTGLEPAIRALRKAGCRVFFVAHASEGVRARAALGFEAGVRIYVLNGLRHVEDARRLFSEHGLRPVLSCLADLREWDAASRSEGVGLPAALQFDTGMNRLGVAPSELDAALQLVIHAPYALEESPPPRHGRVVSFGLATTPATAVAAARRMGTGPAPTLAPGVYVDLVMSHFVSSEIVDDPLNWRQITAFRKIAPRFPYAMASLANSAGIFLPQHPVHDLVRPGYALYGGNPTPTAENPMRPVVTLEAPILQLRDIESGETVGYNGQWTARRASRIATIGVGYADGFPRALMATDARLGGEAIVQGQRCPFAGRVSMDLITIDVTDVADSRLAPGLKVELLGETIGVDEVGARAGTIGYEVLTNLGRRYHRVYTHN